MCIAVKLWPYFSNEKWKLLCASRIIIGCSASCKVTSHASRVIFSSYVHTSWVSVVSVGNAVRSGGQLSHRVYSFHLRAECWMCNGKEVMKQDGEAIRQTAMHQPVSECYICMTNCCFTRDFLWMLWIRYQWLGLGLSVRYKKKWAIETNVVRKHNTSTLYFWKNIQFHASKPAIHFYSPKAFYNGQVLTYTREERQRGNE